LEEDYASDYTRSFAEARRRRALQNRIKMPKIPIPEEKSVVLDKSVVSEKIDVRSKSIEPAKKARLHDWNYNKSHRE
jgi:hypothetical protein